jgi:acyl-CoA synthetase (AMP-forming)/AMP-acid ligase II
MPVDSHPRDKPAVTIFGGPMLDFGTLDDRSARLARLLDAAGLQQGDRIAIFLGNGLACPVAAWAARRGGFRAVPVNWQLQTQEVGYIIDDSDARALVASHRLLDVAEQAVSGREEPCVRLTDGDGKGSFSSLDDAIADYTTEQLPGRFDGPPMYYSSGTTGRPKGILRAIGPLRYGQQRPIEAFYADLYGITSDSRLLIPAPLYFAAPFGWVMSALALGAEVVLLERFDPEHVLQAIERHRITHGLFVPTHFIRMLRLPDEARGRYDLTSLEVAVHAGAPCPPSVKRDMIDWWGPCIHEYYSGSEGAGFTTVSATEWLERPGTVGRARGGAIHILDDAGRECPIGETGSVFFENAPRFEYHKAPEKTALFYTPEGWGSLGDVGRVDAEGYLYLTDRKVDLIISGGANIYSQEIEAQVIEHPAILDAAAIGIPDAEFGEQVKLIVQPVPEAVPGSALAADILAWCRSRVAGFKCPRSIDFVEQLPRHANGKLMKRELKARYADRDQEELEAGT